MDDKTPPIRRRWLVMLALALATVTALVAIATRPPRPAESSTNETLELPAKDTIRAVRVNANEATVGLKVHSFEVPMAQAEKILTLLQAARRVDDLFIAYPFYADIDILTADEERRRISLVDSGSGDIVLIVLKPDSRRAVYRDGPKTDWDRVLRQISDDSATQQH